MSGISINATTAKICNDLPESRHLDFRRQASSPGDFLRLPTSARTSDSLRDSENAVEMYNSRDMCENSFSHMSSRHLSSRSSLLRYCNEYINTTYQSMWRDYWYSHLDSQLVAVMLVHHTGWHHLLHQASNSPSLSGMLSADSLPVGGCAGFVEVSDIVIPEMILDSTNH